MLGLFELLRAVPISSPDLSIITICYGYANGHHNDMLFVMN